MSTIIYLNGPSSAGKTTLAKALQDALAEPYLHVGIDKFIGFMPAKINNWEGGPAPLGFSWEQAIDPAGHPVHHILAGPFANKISRTFKDFAILLASQNYNLIIDDIAFGATEVEEWKQALKDFNVLYVGVAAPLEVLEQRERNRGDRLLGGARGQYYTVHEDAAYDIEIDTHSYSIEESLEAIQQALSKKTMQVQAQKKQSGFAVIYHGYIKPGRESDYENAWSLVAQYFVEHRGAIGSCLHRTAEGLWVAYSRWPDEKTRDASWSGDDASSKGLPSDVYNAVLTIKDCIEQKLPDICMEVVNDILLR